MRRDLFDLVMLWLVFFFNFASLFMYSSILGFFAQELGASDILVGTIFALSGMVALISRLPIAALSDRYGLRPFILLGQLLRTFAIIILLFANEPSILLVSQFVAGLAGSCFLSNMYSFTAMRFLSKEEGGIKSREAVGYAVTGFPVGGLVGPALTSAILLVGGTNSQVFTVATLFGFVGFIIGFFVIKGETRTVIKQTAPKEKGKGGVRELFSATFGLVFLAKSASNYGTKGVKASFVPLFANERLGFPKAEVPLLFTISNIPSIIARPLAGRFKRSEPTILALACVLASASYVLLIFSGWGLPSIIWVAMMLNGFADGLFTPTAIAYVARIVPDAHRALGMAILSSGLDVGRAFGAFVSGTIKDLGGGYETIFLVTALVALSGVIIKIRSKKTSVVS